MLGMSNWMLWLVIGVLGAGAVVTACAAPKGGSSQTQTARQQIEAGALVLDVRTPEEFATGHLEGALLIPVQELSQRLGEVQQQLPAQDKTQPIVVYCRSGGRAARAEQILREAGFTEVTNGGGYSSLRVANPS